MQTSKTALLGLLALTLSLSTAAAEGLLGERYAHYDLGYERFDGFDSTMDGFIAGVELNAPIPAGDPYVGLDFNAAFDYTRVSGGGDRLEIYEGAAKVRGFLLPDADYPLFGRAVKPYAEVGLGLSRAKVTGDDLEVSGRSPILPLGLGIEVVYDYVAITPFFEYVSAFDDDLRDRWSAGAKLSYFFPADWAATLTLAHTDWGGDIDSFRATLGIVFPY